ncbi:hypothetical protein AVT69_gp036 [Pseudomonas phage PhiPA3]|uniref:Uncharacterized protein 035 n=1 Tax=Pseudomonas phage PhiPA3 TaxID=998086 RepID=F8SJR7_BPPA3|nr:hypothetical protein AVT69_gp036 [Pseudomonas phage PhiPA3]AEH03462.1 hypothetical protein [Pseudomonas phage PhiPA3]
MTIIQMIFQQALEVKRRFFDEVIDYGNMEVHVNGASITFNDDDGNDVAKVDFMTNEVVCYRCDTTQVYDVLKAIADQEED